MNIVFICLDTYRADMVRAAGRNDVIQTPSMDNFAGQGVLFENAYGEGQPTIEFRRALVTGMRSFPWDRDYDTRGLWPTTRGWHKIPPEQDTIAEVLLDQGWTTGLVADTYHMFKPTQNFTRGMAAWEFIRGQESDNWRTGPLDRVPYEKYSKKGFTPPGSFALLTQYLLNQQDRRSEDDYQAGRVFRAAIRHLEQNRANSPFFLWIDSFSPHEPFDPPKKYADIYDPDWDEDWEPILGWPKDESVMTEKVQRRVKALYMGFCTYVDKWVGAFLEKLDELKMTDDTLVFICSDHGTELWDHGRIGKNEHAVRIRINPEILFMVRLPGGDHAGKRVPALVQNHDIVPTSLAMAGVDHKPVQGENILPLITGEKDKVRDVAITGWSARASVRSLDYAYSCEFEAPDPKEMLYDTKADPGETKDIAPEKPDVVSEYRGHLESLLGQTLPAKPRDVVHPPQVPFRIWAESKPGMDEYRNRLA